MLGIPINRIYTYAFCIDFISGDWVTLCKRNITAQKQGNQQKPRSHFYVLLKVKFAQAISLIIFKGD